MGVAFHEVTCVRQTPGEPHLRWFQCSYFDLFLWQDKAGEPCRFQLCYSLGYNEHALTWIGQTNTVAHHFVDDGKTPGAYGGTPMLCAPRQAPPPELGDRFRAVSDAVPPAVRKLVLEVLAKAAACVDHPAHR
jgi:hypothetical protein